MSRELEQIKALVSTDLHSVDQVIISQLQSDIPLIDDIGKHIVHSGGKRLRPLVALLAANACGYNGKHHIDLATAVEFLHTATLLHDDVVDKSEMRRGGQTANTLWGNPASVLVGDFIFTRAFQLIAKVQDPLVTQTLAEATNVIAQGEVMQLMHCHDPDTTEQRYLEVICFKTATLFQAAAKLGAILAKRTEDEIVALAAFGLHLGNAFQLIDDVLDYNGDRDKIGKNIGDDLAEGKVTLPLIHALQHCSGHDKLLIQNAIKAGKISDLDAIINAINAHHSIDYAYQTARSQIDHAITALQILPDSNYKAALQSLAEFVVTRDF